MVAPSRENDIDEWIELSESLSPLENLSLIGLLFLKPSLPPSIIAKNDLVNSENISSSERWLLENFRKLLLYSCDKYEDTRVQVTSELVKRVRDAIDVKEIIKATVKHLAPVIVTAYSVPLGIAVAVLYFLIGKQFQRWCGKYAKRHYSGKGTLYRESPTIQLEAYFEVDYHSPIEELVEDPAAFPLPVPKAVIKLPAEIIGKVKLPASHDASEVLSYSTIGKKEYFFSFTDVKTKREILGQVSMLLPSGSEGGSVLRFTAEDLQVEPSSRP